MCSAFPHGTVGFYVWFGSQPRIETETETKFTLSLKIKGLIDALLLLFVYGSEVAKKLAAAPLIPIDDDAEAVEQAALELQQLREAGLADDQSSEGQSSEGEDSSHGTPVRRVTSKVDAPAFSDEQMQELVKLYGLQIPSSFGGRGWRQRKNNIFADRIRETSGTIVVGDLGRIMLVRLPTRIAVWFWKHIQPQRFRKSVLP
jgi:hypothetical protein